MVDSFEIFREGASKTKKIPNAYIRIGISLYIGFMVTCFTFEGVTRKYYNIQSSSSIEAIKDKKAKVMAMSARNRAEQKRNGNPIASAYLAVCLTISCTASLLTLVFLIKWLVRNIEKIGILHMQISIILMLLLSCVAATIYLFPPQFAEWCFEKYG